jgi:dTDP-4-dehydrorhamnose reductase
MKKVLVTGAAGLLGQHLVKELLKSAEVLAIDKNENPFEESEGLRYLQADLIEITKIQDDVTAFAPRIIFNCAAYTDVDGCESNKPLADQLNVGLVENLIKLPHDKFVHFSTDYVFDGQRGPYGESDPVKPLGYYGQTKLRSENILQKSGKPYLIIRSNVLYGHAKNIRPNFLTWLIDNLRQNQKVRLVTDQFNNPISAANLATASIEAASSEITGILHIAGADYFSRYDIGKIVARHFKLNQRLIEPITTYQLQQIAPRPHLGGLKIDKAKRLLKTPLMGLEESLVCMDDYQSGQ